MKKVSVIIPFYRAEITSNETIALGQCFKVLSAYDVIAIKPHRLTLPVSVQEYPFKNIVNFDDTFFENVKGYNALMLSDKFYSAFLDYEFILIHQLDAFVFTDQLSYWCNQKYDYIGAPWLRDCDHPDIFKAIKSSIRQYIDSRYDIRVGSNREPSKYQYDNRVGNGGFSLRRTAKFYGLCVQNRDTIDHYLNKGGHHFNEDRFWCVEVNRKKRRLTIPGYKTGVAFSFEMAPERALRINNGRLPFGCHAWDKHADFWRPLFKSAGYEI